MLIIANNHILDYGSEGLRDTVKVLDNQSINHIGAGNNLSDASKPYIFRQVI